MILILVAAVLYAIGTVSDRTSPSGPSEADSDRVDPGRQQLPVTVSGSGIENSRPFTLVGGDYLVEWTATPDTPTGCYHGAHLDSTDPERFVYESLTNELLDSADPASGTTYLYGVDPGEYYVEVSSGCDWSFTFTQR